MIFYCFLYKYDFWIMACVLSSEMKHNVRFKYIYRSGWVASIFEMSLYLECDKQTADHESIPFQNGLTNCFFRFPDSQGLVYVHDGDIKAIVCTFSFTLQTWTRYLLLHIMYIYIYFIHLFLFFDGKKDSRSTWIWMLKGTCWLSHDKWVIISNLMHAGGISCLFFMLYRRFWIISRTCYWLEGRYDCWLLSFYKKCKTMQVQMVPFFLTAYWSVISYGMNETMLFALLTKCKDVIMEEQHNHGSFSLNTTTVIPSQTTVTNLPRESYDNAYFYILFVMFIYFLLALTLFRSFLQNEKMTKDPYEDSKSSADATACKYSEDSTSGKFDFEDETIV